MKLNAKLISVKGLVAKVLTVGVLAGAVAMIAPAKAQAQQVYRGGRGVYRQHGFYERERIEPIRRYDAWVRPEEFRRFHHGGIYRGYR